MKTSKQLETTTSPRRTYRSMRLVRHGDLHALTRGGRKKDGKAKDDGVGSSPA